MILLGTRGPLGHDFSAKLIKSLAGETHKLEDLRPADGVTHEVHLNLERAEAQLTGVVLEDSFPTHTLPANGGYGCENNLIGTACGQVGLFHDRLTASFSANEFGEHVFLASIASYEFGPNFSAKLVGVVEVR